MLQLCVILIVTYHTTMSGEDITRKNIHGRHRWSATKIIARVNEIHVLDSSHSELDQVKQLKLSLITEMVKADEVAGEIEHSDNFKDGIHGALVKD